jgi:hypothetical protein
MANDIVDKIYVLVEEAKKTKHDSSIVFSETIARRKLEEFSYYREGKIRYCDWPTIREYIAFSKDINALTDDLSTSPALSYKTKIGFKTRISDIILEYFKTKGISISTLQTQTVNLIDARKLPTTEILFQSIKADISEKHFRWALTLMQSVSPLTLDVCRKWIWVPAKKFEF